MISPSWAPDWARRLEAAVRERGFDGIQAFLDANPGRSYASLAATLGVRFAEVQLLSLLYSEARRCRRMRHASADTLVRVINEDFPGGWVMSADFEWKHIELFSAWSSGILATGGCPELEPTLDAVTEYFRNNPPEERWKPSGTTDPYIEAAFRQAWPEGYEPCVP